MRPKGIGVQVRRLLRSGRSSYRDIAEKLGCSKHTVSYHAARIGLSRGRRFPVYDWISIQRYHDQGHTRAECLAHWGLGENAWEYAQRRGYLKTHVIKAPLMLVLKQGYRGSVKRRLIKEGILVKRCAVCACEPFWLGKPLVLRLDHINGIPTDYRIENLRLVCPNCDSQLETFAGRNRHWRLKKASSTQQRNVQSVVPQAKPDHAALV
jgi:hypothetical protein